MRFVKMLGLAAVAALAAMAFVGTGSASADTICEENVGHQNECPAEKRLKEGDLFEGLAIKNATGELAVLLVNLEWKMECGSKILGKVGANEGAHTGLWGLITELSFYDCTGLCLAAKGHSLPFLFLLNALKLHVIISKHKEGLKPGALLEGCSFLKLDCLYEIAAETALLDIAGDTLIALKVPLLRSDGIHSTFCPESGEWDATYLMTLHNDLTKPLYATSLP